MGAVGTRFSEPALQDIKNTISEPKPDQRYIYIYVKEAHDFLATAIAVIGTQDILNVVQSAASLSNLQLVTVLYEPQ